MLYKWYKNKPWNYKYYTLSPAWSTCNILICMQKHSQHNKDERTQFYRKIYLSLYSEWYERVTKGLLCERWVGDWTKTATYWPPALLAIAALLSHSAGLLNRGPEGSAFAGTWFSLLELQQLTPNSDLQLTRTSCCTGLYNCLTSTCFRSICYTLRLVWFGLVLWHINFCRLFNGKAILLEEQ